MAEPKWNEAGEPENLEAAAADAGKWLELVDTFTYAGTWKFSKPDSRARLLGCREQLAKFIAAAHAPLADSHTVRPPTAESGGKA